MCCARLVENTGRKKSPKIRHLRTIAQLCRAISSQIRYISTIRENLLNSSISSICSHSMLNFGPLTAEIDLGVWGTLANFSGFRVLASLLHRRRSMEVNQTSYDVWPSPGLVHYIYIIGDVCPLTEFCQVQSSLASKSCVLIYWQRHCTALEQSASAKFCGVVQGMELQNFRYSSFSTEGAIYIP